MGKSALVRETAEQLYQRLMAEGVEVLFDDRDDRLGVMLADQELMGIPLRLVIGERNLKNGQVEVQGRCQDQTQLMPWETISRATLGI